jgi:hypothetical protein
VVPVIWHDIHGSRMRVRPGLAASVLWDLLRIPIIHRGVHGRGTGTSSSGRP